MSRSERNYFIAQSYVKVSNAGSKPSSDFECVLHSCGFKTLGLKSIYTSNIRYWWIRNWISAKLSQLTMPRDSVIIFQYPEQRHLGNLLHTAKSRGNKIVMLIHDINELRGFPNNHPEWLRQADAVIAHSPSMQKWLKDNYGVDNSVSLGIFDYISNELPLVDTMLGHRPSVVYAGRLDKSGFLRNLCRLNPSVDFVLFGPGCPDDLKAEENVKYMGVCPPEELPSRISKFNFGLVWDGDSVDGCGGTTGNYVKYNSPYKISSYLAAGLPVIVWSRMAVAQFVGENNLGLSVESLAHLSDELKKVTASDYEAFICNVERARKKLTNGGYYRDAILKVLEMI